MKNATEVENVIITDVYYFLKRKTIWQLISMENYELQSENSEGTTGNCGLRKKALQWHKEHWASFVNNAQC